MLITSTVGANAPATNQLDSEAFMKMLMTQLQYQDPSAPMDNAQMVSQLSNMTMMQQNAELVKAMNSLKEQAYKSQGLYASNLVGKEVMVMANLFQVKQGRLPNGEVLLSHTTATNLVIRIYKKEVNPENTKPLAQLTLGKQDERKVPYDLDDLNSPLNDGSYMMYAYSQVEEKEIEQVITQRSKVISVVIPGNGQDVLVEAQGIGLVPLHSLTEFKGDYIAAEEPAQSQNDPFAALAGKMDKVERDGQRWTRNPLFKKTSMRANHRIMPVSRRSTLFRTVP